MKTTSPRLSDYRKSPPALSGSLRKARLSLRLSRPLYESLPWMYICGGLFALVVSYTQSSSVLSVVVGLPGLIALMAGIVVLLRRRDYRTMRMHYARPDALSEPTRED